MFETPRSVLRFRRLEVDAVARRRERDVRRGRPPSPTSDPTW